MSNLSSFRKDAEPQPRLSGRLQDFKTPDRPARKGPPDRDRCPAGWDADVWHLVLRFEQYARADRIELAAGRPVIYAEISDLVSRHGMRDRKYRQEVRCCEHRHDPEELASRCWYHYPPRRRDIPRQEARELTWVEMVEVIMAEFWSRIQNEHALDYFRRSFAEYGQTAVTHWKRLRILASIEDNPRPPRAVMRRRASGDTMAAADKEG